MVIERKKFSIPLFLSLIMLVACANKPTLLTSFVSPTPTPPLTGRIAFISKEGLSVINADGSEQILLSDYGVDEISPPAWSPDGKRIAFVSYNDIKNFTGIYITNIDGSNLVHLTQNGPSNSVNLTWSPDGTRIAIASWQDGIYVINVDGSGLVNLTQGAQYYRYPYLTWSPDGKHIAFLTYIPRGSAHLHVINADGSREMNLTKGLYGEDYPAWSPDNKRIAFINSEADIYVMDADGTNRTQLTNTRALDSFPVWSPTGTQIVFVSQINTNNPSCSSVSTPCNYEIYVMNADGSEQINLTNNPAYDFAPAWSPDGTHIAFISTRDNPNPIEDSTTHIYVMDADGRNVTRLTNNLFAEYYPTWAPR